MQEVDFIWLNGKMVPWKEATTHFLTHSLHYGTAVFEGIRFYKTDKGPAIFRLGDHVKRLFESAKIVGMKNLPFTEEQVFDAIKLVVKENKLESGYIRPLFYYGYGKMGMDTIGAKIDLGIAAWPWGAYHGFEGVQNGISMKISSIVRHSKNSPFVHSKVSGSYYKSTFAKMDALDSGFDEAIMLDANGIVAECTGENLFLVKEGKLVTPGEKEILVGITRDSIMQLAKDEGIEVVESVIEKEQLNSADECFITGTAAEIVPVGSIEGKTLGSGKPGSITSKLQKAYSDLVHGKNEKRIKWLDFV